MSERQLGIRMCLLTSAMLCREDLFNAGEEEEEEDAVSSQEHPEASPSDDVSSEADNPRYNFLQSWRLQQGFCLAWRSDRL